VGEQSEKAATGEVLAEKDDSGGNPMARLRKPVLRAGSWCRRGAVKRHTFWSGPTAQGRLDSDG
jgi:hypothetical protein